jgi:hypothetical protein
MAKFIQRCMICTLRRPTRRHQKQRGKAHYINRRRGAGGDAGAEAFEHLPD